MDLQLQFESWHVIAFALAIAFHAGTMWYKVNQIQQVLERIADDHEKRLRYLEKKRVAS